MARQLFSSSTVVAPPSTSVRILTALPPTHPEWSGQALRLADLQSAIGRRIDGVLSTDPSGALPAFYGPDGVSTLYALQSDGTTTTLTAGSSSGSGTSGAALSITYAGSWAARSTVTSDPSVRVTFITPPSTLVPVAPTDMTTADVWENRAGAI